MRSFAVVCGVDIGSTNVKVVALDESGAVLAITSRPTPREPRFRAIDVAELFLAIEDMLLDIAARGLLIHAVAVAGVGEDGVLVDARLEPLVPAMAWFDPRRQSVFESVRELLAEETELGATGVGFDPARTLVGWAWARAEHPDALAAARSWVALTDYAAVRWSGSPFMSDSLASRTAAWQPESRRWIQSRVAGTLGSSDLLAPVVGAGAPVGPFRSQRLDAAGALAPGALVVAGGHDHPIGGWGVAQFDSLAVLDSMGTAEVVVAQSPDRATERIDDIDVSPGIRQPGTTLLSVTELARNIEWAASSDAATAESITAIIAGTARPEPSAFDSYFTPGEQGGYEPRWSRSASRLAPIERASAVLASCARLGAEAVDAVASRFGSERHVYAAGGWARSEGWLSLKRAVGDREISVIPTPEVTAVGAALLAGAALGWEQDAGVALGIASVATP